jgi:hypothetical protein
MSFGPMVALVVIYSVRAMMSVSAGVITW